VKSSAGVTLLMLKSNYPRRLGGQFYQHLSQRKTAGLPLMSFSVRFQGLMNDKKL